MILSKITEIEAGILQLGPGEFQKFCDTLLSKTEEYGKIHGLGMKSGTLKTTIGNPDTYFRKENGKYVFVAYTTQQNDIFNKLKEDIEKCLDPNETKLPLKEIDEIVCCHTSSNLLAGKDKELHTLCEERGIKLTIYGVDEIAQLVYRKYPILADDFLGISIDTKQIMPLDEFVELYNSNKMAAPLDTKFQGREQELSKLIDGIRSDNKIVIVHGSAGVGKTKIVLESAKIVAREDGYQLLCIKNNNLSLYEDLVAKTERPGRYLFFVDDANELPNLELILQYLSKESQGYQVRIILTVRDYVKGKVVQLCQNYAPLIQLELEPFSDEDIRTFLEQNMGIKNYKYINLIVRIAGGNPRIAYMAGKVALKTNSLLAVHDATQVYEQYYASTISDSQIGADKKLRLTAGILAIAHVVILNRANLFTEILKLGNLTVEDFKDCLFQLESIEIVEIHENTIAAISDQCFANYILYYVFFEKKEILLSEILAIGFKYFRDGIIHTVDTLLYLFAKKELRTYIENEVIEVWDRYQSEKEYCYEEFARHFHIFRPEEAFILANEKIETIHQEKIEDKEIDFKQNILRNGEEILGYLSGYEYSQYFETALELLLLYVKKSADNAVIGYNWLKSHYGVGLDAYKNDYHTEKALDDVLSHHLNDNLYVQRFILAHIHYALSFEFESVEGSRRNTLRIYRGQIKNCSGVKAYRKRCWESLDILASVGTLHCTIENILHKYAKSIVRAEDSTIVEDDKYYVNVILEKVFTSNIRKGCMIRDLYYGWKRHGIRVPDEVDIFQTESWQLYLLLSNDYYYSELPYDEYMHQHEENLDEYSRTLNSNNISRFIRQVNEITIEKQPAKDNSIYDIQESVNKILEKACTEEDNAEIAFVEGMNKDLVIDICPDTMLKTLFTVRRAIDLLQLIEEHDFLRKNEWIYKFFCMIPDEMVEETIYHKLIEYLKSRSDENITRSTYRNLRFLDKFLKIDENIYVTASDIIYKKREYSKFIVQIYFTLLFHEQRYSANEIKKLFETDLDLLKKIYFFMLENHDIADLKGVFLSTFLDIDDSWLRAFANTVIEKIRIGGEYDYYRYRALWMTDGYLKCFDYIFEKIADAEDNLSEWKRNDALKAVFYHKSEDDFVLHRQEEWVLHVVQKYAKDKMIIVLFGVLSEYNTSLRKIALLEFLKYNDDFEFFREIPLDNDHWGGEESEIIPQMLEHIDYLESLLPQLVEVKFLKHAKCIRDRIEVWKERIKREEMNAVSHKYIR